MRAGCRGRDQQAHRPARRRVLHQPGHRQPGRDRQRAERLPGHALAGKTAESNVALGDTITVFFKQRKIDRARVQGKASGEYHLPVAVADTGAARNEVISYDAEAIHYLVPKNQIVLDHSAHLTYRDLELRARRVEFNSEKQTLVAEGSPELVDRGDKVTGHLMTYDLESRVGNIYQAATSYEKGPLPRRAHRQGERQGAGREGRPLQHVRSRGPALSLRGTVDEDLPQGQTDREAGGVLRAQRSAARAAVRHLPNQGRPPLRVPVSADGVRVQLGGGALHPQRRLLLGAQRLLRLHRLRRLLRGRSRRG